jgi:hypothetical protein
VLEATEDSNSEQVDLQFIGGDPSLCYRLSDPAYLYKGNEAAQPAQNQRPRHQDL